MARYSQNSISEVSRRNNLVDVVSSYVKLKRNGNNYTGLCPFHKEKTPSFHVSEDKQLYYCFGCGAGGNLFDFIMHMENLDFVDALKLLAERGGVTLEEEKGSYQQSREELDKKQRIYEMNVLTARHFVENLFEKGAVLPQQYLRKRELTKETAIKFGLGYAKNEWNDLHSFLTEKGFSDREMLDAGLVVKNEKGHIYDKFRNRLMFPIINVRGSVIAFSGRALGDDPAKYMNSPETPVFHKGNNLFNLNLAKQYGQKEGLLLVEGNVDVASLYQRGICNAVAGLGTAFTSEQAMLLRRYSGGRVYVCYDSDEAGQKAATKVVDILTEAGCKANVVRFSGAKDPDEYILKKGVESFRECMKQAVGAVEYKIMRLRSGYDLTNIDAKVAFVTEAAKILAQIENQIEREAYVNRIAAETDISASAILTEIHKLVYQAGKKAVRKEMYAEQTEEPSTAIENAATQSNVTYKAERMLLNIVFFQRRVFELAKEELSPQLFSGTENRSIYEAMLAFKNEMPEADAAAFLSYIDSSLKKSAAAILYREYECDSVQAAKDMIKKLKGELMNNRIKQLSREGKAEEVNELIRQYTGRRS